MNKQITPEEYDRLMSEYFKELNPDDVWVVFTTWWDLLCSLIISEIEEET